jgi:steroid delta-isomerase-like uncharacterized protein
MSEQNKAVVRRFYEEFANKKNEKALGELLAPTFTDHTPMPGTAAGLEGVKQQIAMFRKAFPDMKLTVEEMTAEGNTVMARFKATGTHTGSLMGEAATGKKFTITGIDCFQIKGGKATDVWHYGDEAMTMQQLGIKPPGT